MCRLFMANRNGLLKLEKECGVLNELDLLELSCGGDGNGYMLIKNGVVTKWGKGQFLTNENIVDVINQNDFDWFFYHTRISSIGVISDSNCHPYVNKKRTLGLIMNGTETKLSELAKYYKCTDTEVVFKLLNEVNGTDLDLLLDMDSRYMGVKDGRIFVKNTMFSPLEYVQYEDGGLVIASQFGKNVDSEYMGEGLWLEGEEIPEAVYVDYSAYYGANKSIYDYFDDEKDYEMVKVQGSPRRVSQSYIAGANGYSYYNYDDFKDDLKECK